MYGLQEVKLYLRTLRQIIEDLLRHLRYRDLQYLHFEYRERNGERVFGPANRGHICAATPCKQGTGAKGWQSETGSTYAFHPGESRADDGR